MSYCRWSTDDFRCDLYIYDSDRGTEVHVTSGRYDIPDDAYPPPVSFMDVDINVWFERHKIVDDLIHEAETKHIGGPFDGKSFTFDTPSEAADWIEHELAPLGIYRFPDDLVEALREEEE